MEDVINGKHTNTKTKHQWGLTKEKENQKKLWFGFITALSTTHWIHFGHVCSCLRRQHGLVTTPHCAAEHVRFPGMLDREEVKDNTHTHLLMRHFCADQPV